MRKVRKDNTMDLLEKKLKVRVSGLQSLATSYTINKKRKLTSDIMELQRLGI
jgi:hypothetical protein